jgi:6-phosphogluconolactonase
MAVEIVEMKDGLEGAFAVGVKKMLSHLYEKPAEIPLAIGLCGGRSVVGFLDALDSELRNTSKEFRARLHFFMVDERLVPLDHQDSNYGALRTQVFDRLIKERILAENQLHPFQTTDESRAKACENYTEQLKACGGEFSVVVLGMGEDGHVASLFPSHPLLLEEEKGFVTIEDSPKAPPERMTATRRLLEQSTVGILLALGEGKREAWDQFNTAGQSITSCPATLVRSVDNLYIITDLT